MQNRNPSAGTNVDSNTNADAPTSSPNNAKPHVVGSLLRPFEFRAWDVYNQRMVYNPYMFEPKPDYLFNPEPYRFYEIWNDVEDGVGRFGYIMQFTGLFDKQNKKIFEGDLCRWPSGNVNIIVWTERATFSALDLHPKKNGRAGITGYFVEIIGNIFETPELLG